MFKFAEIKLDEDNVMPRQDFASPLIVEIPLQTSAYTGNGHPPVEEIDGLCVLTFAILNDESEFSIPSIDREGSHAPILSRIATQKVKPMLANRIQTKRLVAEIKDIIFIAANSARRLAGCRFPGSALI